MSLNCKSCEYKQDQLTEKIMKIESLTQERNNMREALKEILDSSELMETLADIEHQRWARWFNYSNSLWCETNIKRWGKLADTRYSELSEESKQSDRNEVRITLTAIRQALTQPNQNRGEVVG